MTSPYRTDQDALRQRLAELDAELARLRAFGAELEKVRAQEAALAKEAEDVRRRLGEKRALPLLDRVAVASPCSASWDDMLGDERVRFCLKCEKNVYNLSALPREEAEAFLASRVPSGETCVRFYQRADGTLLTSDCPVGATKKRRKKLALAIAGAGAVAAAAVSALAKPACGPRATMGAVAVYAPHPVDPAADDGVRAVQGEMAPVEVRPEPKKHEPPVQPLMGRVQVAR